MFQRLHQRGGHYLLLVLTTAALALPNLGTPSLWDIDEGNNAEASREMLEEGSWHGFIVPTFNYQLRPDKPALLYWLQMAGYRVFGIGEFAARFPSGLAGLAAVLLTYELGRSLFGAATGLLAGLVLASTAMVCAAAHFANPDALLLACTVLVFFVFWQGLARAGWGWFVAAGVGSGLAVLAKGPVGLVLPLGVIGLFLLWSGRLGWLLNRRLAWSAFAFCLVALPWYALVGAETKGDFLRGFLLIHNAGRYLAPMEGHSGPPFYYLVVLLLGFAPWSVFLGAAGWYALGRRGQADRDPLEITRGLPDSYRFLWCWIAFYLVFFSFGATKLPNYILPLYPPVALLTARFLERWRQQLIAVPPWAIRVSLACLGLVGLTAILGFLVLGGSLGIPSFHGRRLLLPGLSGWAATGILPIAGALVAGWCIRRQQRGAALAAIAVSAVVFIGLLAGGVGPVVDGFKAPRPLAQALQAEPGDREVRVGSYAYDQPSVVFYCRRKVKRLPNEERTLEFLRFPVPVYLFVPAPLWERLEAKVTVPHHLLCRHHDLYRNCEVVVVTNR